MSVIKSRFGKIIIFASVMRRKKILVIDDERDLCEILLFNLMTAGYQAEAVYSAEEALQKNIPSYDLILLDVMMPGMSGFELASKLKSDSSMASVPIIFLTAKDTEDDKLFGFHLGADDYVSKPFSVREVLARVKAVIGRTSISDDVDNLVYKDLKMDLGKMTVTVEGKKVPLTKTEFEILRIMLEQRGVVFSRQCILERIWPRDVVVTDRTVDVNITRMRKKLGRYSQCIIARQGFGYVFEEL